MHIYDGNSTEQSQIRREKSVENSERSEKKIGWNEGRKQIHVVQLKIGT